MYVERKKIESKDKREQKKLKKILSEKFSNKIGVLDTQVAA